MCGKFTAMGSWRKVWDFSQPLTVAPCGHPDEEVTYGVAKPFPVIVWDREAKQRHIVPMRWGFPHAKDWRRPQPIHARTESIETTKAFAEAFATGQRGIVTMKNFNEGKELSATKPNNGL
jgi:putative SOS response-associated peptidase YedK